MQVGLAQEDKGLLVCFQRVPEGKNTFAMTIHAHCRVESSAIDSVEECQPSVGQHANQASEHTFTIHG